MKWLYNWFMQYARRVDGNTHEIDEAARNLNLWIVDLSRVGGGVPDRLYVFPGKTMRHWLVELKVPGGRLTKAEAKFIKEHPGLVTIVHSPEELIDLIRL